MGEKNDKKGPEATPEPPFLPTHLFFSLSISLSLYRTRHF
jgi:hypothetical protein